MCLAGETNLAKAVKDEQNKAEGKTHEVAHETKKTAHDTKESVKDTYNRCLPATAPVPCYIPFSEQRVFRLLCKSQLRA